MCRFQKAKMLKNNFYYKELDSWGLMYWVSTSLEIVLSNNIHLGKKCTAHSKILL